jgi:hypothetical protein
MVEQEGHSLMDFGVIDGVVVIENQVKLVWQLAEFVDHGGEDTLGRWLTRFQEREDALPESWPSDHLERGEDMRPKGAGLVVSPIEGQPGHGALVNRARREPMSNE